MSAVTYQFDLSSLRLNSGEGRTIELDVAIEPLELAGQAYRGDPECVRSTLEISRMVGAGYALRLRFQCALVGPCMRCLEPASPLLEVQAREVDKPGEGEELQSPYLKDELLDLAAWARDALALAMPAQILCRTDCAGLCPTCAANLNTTDDEHHHDSPPDPRWAKLGELKLN